VFLVTLILFVSIYQCSQMPGKTRFLLRISGYALRGTSKLTTNLILTDYCYFVIVSIGKKFYMQLW